MKEFKISKEVAEEQLELFMEEYDCDFEEMEEEQAVSLKVAKKRVIRAIRRGLLEITRTEDKLVVKQTLAKSGDFLYYAELSGQSKVAMKTCSSDDHNGRLYALTGSLTGVGAGGILKMKGQDLSLVESLGVLFLLI